MDYGQDSSKMSNDRLFEQAITQGEGIAPENSNPDVAESLHATDNSISWEAHPVDQPITPPATPNHSALGKKANRALSSTDATPDTLSPNPPEPIPPHPNQIASEPMPLTMPPSATTRPTPASTTPAASKLTGILSHLHLSPHHKFTDADAKIVDEAIAASGDDISDLYDAVRGLVPVATDQAGGQNGK